MSVPQSFICIRSGFLMTGRLPAAEECVDVRDDLPFTLPALRQEGEHRPGMKHARLGFDLIILYPAAEDARHIADSLQYQWGTGKILLDPTYHYTLLGLHLQGR